MGEIPIALCRSVREISFYPKNVECAFHKVGTDGVHQYNTVGIHVVILLILKKTGERFAFDPTGVQFGWGDLVAPWTIYSEHRISQIVNELPSSSAPYCFHPPDGYVDHESAVSFVQAYVIHRVTLYLSRSLQGFGVPWTQLATLEEPQFAMLSSAVVSEGIALIDSELQALERSSIGKLFWDPKFDQMYVTDSPEETKILKDAWFTEEEYNELKREISPFALGKMWQMRLKASLLHHRRQGVELGKLTGILETLLADEGIP
ncbi:hypothetical protein AAE478_004860 [Parahypoxylon ruwenzoriense]